jgi:hypothetical protein
MARFIILAVGCVIRERVFVCVRDEVSRGMDCCLVLLAVGGAHRRCLGHGPCTSWGRVTDAGLGSTCGQEGKLWKCGFGCARFCDAICSMLHVCHTLDIYSFVVCRLYGVVEDARPVVSRRL